jgi:hypothetical protein
MLRKLSSGGCGRYDPPHIVQSKRENFNHLVQRSRLVHCAADHNKAVSEALCISHIPLTICNVKHNVRTRNVMTFIETKSPLPCPAEPGIRSYHEPHCFFKMSSNIILPCMHIPSEWSQPLSFLFKISYACLYVSHACYLSFLSEPSWLNHHKTTVFGEYYKSP